MRRDSSQHADVCAGNRMKYFMPPPVTPSDEEPIAAGGRQDLSWGSGPDIETRETKQTIFAAAHDAVG